MLWKHLTGAGMKLRWNSVAITNYGPLVFSEFWQSASSDTDRKWSRGHICRGRSKSKILLDHVLFMMARWFEQWQCWEAVPVETKVSKSVRIHTLYLEETNEGCFYNCICAADLHYSSFSCDIYRCTWHVVTSLYYQYGNFAVRWTGFLSTSKTDSELKFR